MRLFLWALFLIDMMHLSTWNTLIMKLALCVLLGFWFLNISMQRRLIKRTEKEEGINAIYHVKHFDLSTAFGLFSNPKSYVQRVIDKIDCAWSSFPVVGTWVFISDVRNLQNWTDASKCCLIFFHIHGEIFHVNVKSKWWEKGSKKQFKP